MTDCKTINSGKKLNIEQSVLRLFGKKTVRKAVSQLAESATLSSTFDGYYKPVSQQLKTKSDALANGLNKIAVANAQLTH